MDKKQGVMLQHLRVQISGFETFPKDKHLTHTRLKTTGAVLTRPDLGI
jgi:hypothetical protein